MKPQPLAAAAFLLALLNVSVDSPIKTSFS